MDNIPDRYEVRPDTNDMPCVFDLKAQDFILMGRRCPDAQCARLNEAYREWLELRAQDRQ